MALVFPSNPEVNDTYTVNGRTYVWNGTSWRTIKWGIPDVVPTLIVDNDFSAGGTLHVDSTNNEIGIGTAAPSHQLHLTQDLGVDGNLIVGGTITVPTPTAGTNDTTAATTAFVQTAVAGIVDSAPTTLDTLNELAAALGDDANFATTVTNSIALKQDASTALTTSTTFGGDVSGTYNSIVVANDSHTHDGRYYTESESDSLFAASAHTHSYLPLAGGTVTGNLLVGSATEYLAIDYDSDQQLLLVSDTNTGRPYIAFFNQDASGNLDRKGYFGYPDAASNSSTINFVSEQGPILIRSVAGDIQIRPDRYIRFQEDGDTTGIIEMDMSGNPTLTIQNDSASTGDYIEFYCDTTWSRIHAGQNIYINNWIHPDPGVRTYDSGTASAPVYSWREDTNTGLFRGGADQFSLAAGGLTALTVTNVQTVSTAGPSTATTSGFNYVLRDTSFGLLQRYTSCRDTKEQIASFTDSGTIIDQLRPVTFIPKFQPLQEGDTETVEQQQLREVDINYGFIAEEVGEIANGKLAQWEWTEEGQLKVSGWKWPDMIAVLTAEVQSLRARIAQLESN